MYKFDLSLFYVNKFNKKPSTLCFTDRWFNQLSAGTIGDCPGHLTMFLEVVNRVEKFRCLLTRNAIFYRVMSFPLSIAVLYCIYI